MPKTPASARLSPADICIVEGCGRVCVPRSPLCRGHHRRRALNQPMGPLAARGRTPWRVLWDAIEALVLADEQEVERARKRVEVALQRWLDAHREG